MLRLNQRMILRLQIIPHVMQLGKMLYTLFLAAIHFPAPLSSFVDVLSQAKHKQIDLLQNHKRFKLIKDTSFADSIIT
jgi:hypothetical protein